MGVDMKNNIWGVAVTAGTLVSILIFNSLLVMPPASAQLNSPEFKNPPELPRRADEKRLRGIIEIINGDYLIPSVGRQEMRQYRGWDAARARPDLPAPGTNVGPGPTLRTRLGDQVQIAFLNKTDRRKFPYTFVTD